MFGTFREALDYLADRIASEAQQERIPLSEIERKMLYFSETDWTLPEMKAVSEEFQRSFDDDEFEQKTAGLISRILTAERGDNDEQRTDWTAAVAKVSEGDYYLLVMLDMAMTLTESGNTSGLFPVLEEPRVRPPHDRLKLFLVSILVVIVILGSMFTWDWLYRHSGPTFRGLSDWFFEDRDRRGGTIFLVVAAIVIAVWLKSIWAATSRRR